MVARLALAVESGGQLRLDVSSRFVEFRFSSSYVLQDRVHALRTQDHESESRKEQHLAAKTSHCYLLFEVVAAVGVTPSLC
jgi:hypothetical protein